MCESDRVAGRN